MQNVRNSKFTDQIYL